MEKIDIVFFGNGRNSTGNAQAFSKNSLVGKITIMGRNQAINDEINRNRRNAHYLPEIRRLDRKITASGFDFEKIKPEDIVFLGVPSYAQRAVLQSWKPYYRGQRIITTSKGIEILIENSELRSLMFPHQVVVDVLGERARCHHLAGPGFAADLAAGKYATSVLASADFNSAFELSNHLSIKRVFEIQPSNDLIGVEFAGPAKNFIAIAMGRFNAEEEAPSSQSSYFAKLMMEMYELGKKMEMHEFGKNERIHFITLLSPAYLGDIHGSTTPASRNYREGLRMKLLRKIKREETSLVSFKNWTITFNFKALSTVFRGGGEEGKKLREGIFSIYALRQLGKQRKVSLPLLEEVFSDYYVKPGKTPEGIVLEYLK